MVKSLALEFRRLAFVASLFLLCELALRLRVPTCTAYKRPISTIHSDGHILGPTYLLQHVILILIQSIKCIFFILLFFKIFFDVDHVLSLC